MISSTAIRLLDRLPQLCFRVGLLTRTRVDHFFPFFLSAVLLLAFGLQVSGVSVGRWGVDATVYQSDINAGSVVGGSLADYFVVLLTPYLRIGPFPNGIATLGLAYLIARIAYQGGIRERIIILLLTFPLIFQLQFVSKEAIVTVFTMQLYIMFILIQNSRARAILGALSLLAMGVYFRNYYIISLTFAACIFLFRDIRFLCVALLSGLLAASLIPAIREPLIAARLYVYYGVSDFSMSKIPLLFTNNAWYDFVGNYFFSLFYFVFPIFVNQRVNEIYAQVYILITIGLILAALSSGERALACIFIGIALTFPLFVPDLGTLSRHLGAAIPILLMSFHFAPPRRQMV